MSSAISWTDETWNPVTGCDKVSPGCAHCYAEVMSKRLKAMGSPRYAEAVGEDGTFKTGRVVCHSEVVEMPQRWRKPRRVFVNSMGDLWHEDVEIPFIGQVYDTMEECPQHTFQVLTKRPQRRLRWLHDWDICEIAPPPNVWEGVSVENSKHGVPRIEILRQTPAAVRFLSCEPLLEDLRLTQSDLEGIHWVIVGGESGPDYRPMDLGWAQEIRDVCREAGVAFFYKQDAGPRPGVISETARVLGLDVQEFPR